MKKLIYPALTLIMAAAITSCSSDEPSPAPSTTDATEFVLTLPADFTTRSYGDNFTIDSIHYTVFLTDEGKVVSSRAVPVSLSNTVVTTSFKIGLVPGEKYTVVFYADNSESEFAQYKDGIVTVNYDNAADLNGDAFYYVTPSFTADGTAQTAQMARLWAQVNIGTSDMPATTTDVSSTFTITSGLAAEMNLFTGAAKADTQTVAITNNDVAALQSEAFPSGDNYKYLQTFFLLPAADTIDATLETKNGTSTANYPFSSLAMKANYRTNIYGALLTPASTPAEVAVMK